MFGLEALSGPALTAHTLFLPTHHFVTAYCVRDESDTGWQDLLGGLLSIACQSECAASLLLCRGLLLQRHGALCSLWGCPASYELKVKDGAVMISLWCTKLTHTSATFR